MATRPDRRSVDPNTSVLHLLHRARQTGNGLLAGELERHRMTPRQLVILLAIRRQPGCRQRDLETATGVDRSTVADIVARLSARGAIECAAAENDRRAKTVRLTDDGRRLLRRCRESATAAERTLMAPLTGPERKTFRTALEIISGLREAPPPATRTWRRPRRPETAGD